MTPFRDRPEFPPLVPCPACGGEGRIGPGYWPNGDPGGPERARCVPCGGRGGFDPADVPPRGGALTERVAELEAALRDCEAALSYAVGYHYYRTHIAAKLAGALAAARRLLGEGAR